MHGSVTVKKKSGTISHAPISLCTLQHCTWKSGSHGVCVLDSDIQRTWTRHDTYTEKGREKEKAKGGKGVGGVHAHSIHSVTSGDGAAAAATVVAAASHLLPYACMYYFHFKPIHSIHKETT